MPRIARLRRGRTSSAAGPVVRRPRAVPSFVRLAALGLAVATLAAACGGSGSGRGTGGRLDVVTTTTVFADMVAQVGGDHVEVHSLVPKGGDVHTFDPRPSDVRRVSTAGLIVRNGLGLDDWLTRLVEDAGTNATVLTLGEQLDGVQYLDGTGSTTNPHVWMNVAYGVKYVERIEAALAAADPQDASAFASGAAAYTAALTSLDQSIRARLAAVPAQNRVVVSFHDAFPYFAAAYGLTIVGTIIAAPGQDPSAGQIADLVAQIKASGAKAVFAEAQFNDALAQAIAGETGVTVVNSLYDDTVGNPPQDTYAAMMQWNADQVVAALAGG